MAKREKNRWMGIFFGPAVTFFALFALWKNETRFDYYRAAAGTEAVDSPANASSGQLISLTGPMDQRLTMNGDYVESFVGFLKVYRSSEIYCWDREKDSDDDVRWRKRWMSSVENNSRNNGIRKTLSSKTFHPSQYEVGELAVTSDMIEFVDGSDSISPQSLTKTREDFRVGNGHFFLRKHGGNIDKLGDERVSYSGVKVPAKATYFGKFESQKGTADTSHQRTGFINGIIGDTGILHHIVAGDRDTALATMKSHIARIKWIVRGIGTAATVAGFFILFATIVGFLFHIPFIGRIAESGSFLLALALGLPLAFLVIVSSYLIAHPLILAVIVALVAGGIYFIRARGKASQEVMQLQIQEQFADELEVFSLKELEFLELAQLAMSDAKFGDEERAFLKEWGRKHGWSESKFEEMVDKAGQRRGAEQSEVSNDQHLMNLIRIALADGSLSQYEIKTIRATAENLGYDNATIREMMRRVRESAAPSVGA